MSAAIATIGHNRSPFEISEDEIMTLFDEACNFVDGEPIVTAEMADAVERLQDMIQAAIRTAESRRVEEKKPLDEQIKAIQDRWNTLIGDTKSVKGKAILAKDACRRALEPYRLKVEAERRAAAEKARREAEEKARAAQEALRASQVDDLAARAAAEALIADAARTERDAKRADKAATTGLGLRTVTRAEVSNVNAFLKWAWMNDYAALEAYAIERAGALVRAGQRGIPGVEVITEKKAI